MKDERMEAGPVEAGERLFGHAYDELRRLAGGYLKGERAGHSLQATELVNEAYLRLGAGADIEWAGRTHFFAVAARAMRRILVDHARSRGRVKRGDGLRRVTLGDGVGAVSEVSWAEILDVDRALERLAELDARQARVVELRFFAGLDMSEVAEAVGVSKRTAEGDWTHAKAWLKRELALGDRSSP